MSWVLTNRGLGFDFARPDPAQIDIWDIALALSRLCRFNGQTRVAYSVAQHSVLVSDIVPGDFTLEALLHDASEAYLQDLAAPLKSMLPDYRAMEMSISAMINARFGVRKSGRMSYCVWRADLTALATEMRDLMPGDCEPYLKGILPREERIVAMEEDAARAAFLQRFEAYGGRP